MRGRAGRCRGRGMPVNGRSGGFNVSEGLEYSSRGFFPRVVKSPAACSSAVKTGEMSPASVPERGLDSVVR